MSYKTESTLNYLLAEPYWSLDDIIDLAIVSKFAIDLELEDEYSDEIYSFAIDIINDVYDISRNNNFSIIPSVDNNNKYVSFIFSYKHEIIVSMIIVATCFYQLFVYYFSIIFELTFNYFNPNLNTASLTGIPRYQLSWLMALIFPVILIFIEIENKIKDKDRKSGCKTSKDLFEYMIDKAKHDGLTSQFYESDAVIDYFNNKYKFYLPRDPFRVWKDPFFKRNGDFWIIGFQGKRVCLKDAAVMEPIAYLLRSPNKEFYARDFVKGDDDAVRDLKMEAAPIPEDIDQEYQNIKNEILQKKQSKKQVEELIELLEMQANDSDTGQSLQLNQHIHET